MIIKKTTTILLMSSILFSCTPFIPKSGPSSAKINNVAQYSKQILLIDITHGITQLIQQAETKKLFSKTFNKPYKNSWAVHRGDVLEIFIWESAPQLLFGSNSIPGLTSAAATTKNTALPEQVVDQNGFIRVPFAGKIAVEGHTLSQIETMIMNALKGKANYPQVIVRSLRNLSSNVTVVGEVNQSKLVPLTPKRERILDAIAAVGGVKAPINKMTLQLTRGNIVQSMSLEQIIKDPRQNIPLEPSDVLTAYYQPHSFTVLGAAGINKELDFEGQGISLAQALGRIGGLNDNSANASALFIFRFEDPSVLKDKHKIVMLNNERKIPVIYRVNVSDPSTFFIAQYFPMKDKDVVYVSTSPGTDLQKFLQIIGAAVYPVVAGNAIYNAS